MSLRTLTYPESAPSGKRHRQRLAAQQITPQAKVLAKDREISTIEIDYDDLRGMESTILRLF